MLANIARMLICNKAVKVLQDGKRIPTGQGRKLGPPPNLGEYWQEAVKL